MSDSLAAALVEFQLTLPNVAKKSRANVTTAKGPGFGYEYADLSDVAAEVIPALAKVGIAYTASLRIREGGFVLVARLRHHSGESIKSEWPVPLGNPQQMGSAITYGRRYCLLAMSGVHPGGEDDDGAAAVVARPRAQPSDIPEDPDAITPAQRKKLWAQLKRADMENTDVAKAWMSSLLGMEISSTNALTQAQVGILLDELKLLVGRPASRTRPTEPPADQWLINADDGQQS